LFVPPRTARYVVISDIDDTVIHTGVAQKVIMLWRLFVEGARSRVAFPGVAAFYRALHRGATGGELNPLLYVSRGPWSLYDVLDEFFRIHGIPVGPILFLREWGLSWRHPFPRRATDHKLTLIRHMLALYGDLPFLLVGDSGQRDPEIYAQVVREHPGRVLAIYIRNVSQRPHRIRAVEALAREVVEAGSSLLLAADSFAMAAHAAERGLIAPEAFAHVLAERVAQQGGPDLHPTRTVQRPTPEETREAVEQGTVRDALTKETGTDAPPNVVVEPADGQKANAKDQGRA
jgi:phosphatidate phosphatase APP1